MKERSVITKMDVLERTPGGFLSKVEITERALDGSGHFSHIYHLEHDDLAKEMNDFIHTVLRHEAERNKEFTKGIPTAMEFYTQCRSDWDVNGDYPMVDPIRFAIEFTKLHLEAQARAIIKNVSNQDGEKYGADLNERSVLDAYSPQNVK